MANPKLPNFKQSKEDADAWSLVLDSIKIRMKDITKQSEKQQESARGTARMWYDIEESSKKIGTSEYKNVDYSAQQAANAKEQWEIRNGVSKLTGTERINRLAILEQEEKDLDLMQQRAEVQNRQNALLMRGQALVDGMQKKWEEIYDLAVSTVTTWQGAVVTSMALNKHVGGIAQNLGVAHTEAMGFAATGALLGPMFKAMGLDVAQSQKALLDNFNDMDAASIQNVANMGLLQLQTGVTADTAAKASRMFSLIEGSTAAAGISMTKQVADQAKLAGAIPAKVIEDMTANSASIAEYWSGNIESLTAAAAQASKLGLSISNISTAAGKMLNIETSIAAEMEAEVLLGKQLNLEKAREAALMGDSETLMKELVKNAGSLEEFNSMNVIQKQKLAEALGLNVADLQKMVQEEKTSSTTWGKITSEASKYATWISGAVPGAMALANNAMKLKDNLMNLPWGKLGSMFKSGGAADIAGPLTKSGKPDMRYAANRPAAPKAPKPGPGAAMAKTGRGVGGAATSMLKGAAAMLIMGAALWVAAKGFQELAKVDWGALWPGAVIALIALAGALAIFGTPPVSALLLMGAGVFAAMSGGLLLFGLAMMAVGKGVELTRNGLTGFGAIIGELIPLVPGIFALGAAFGIMGIGLISLSAGLIALVPALPVIMALGAMATLALAMGGAGGGAEGEVMEMKSSSIEDKLDALTVAILAQPIQIQLDGKNVGWGVKNAQNKAVDFA